MTLSVSSIQHKYKNFVLQFSFGGVAALVSKTVASPIEVVKLRLQVQQVLLDRGMITHHYEGIGDCLKRLHSENGISAYFKGNGTNALRFFLTHSLNFSFRDLFRSLYAEVIGETQDGLSFMANTVAGGAAGASTQLFVYPLDFARTRLANQVKDKHQFNGLSHCLMKTFKSEGILGLYRGFTVSCLCMIIYRGLNFGIYDSLRPLVPKQQEKNMIYTFALGYFATICSGAVSYPLDTIRRRMMMSVGDHNKITRSVDGSKVIYREGGWKAFFRGGAANVLGGLTGAAVFSIYDRIKVHYKSKYLQ